MTTCAKCGNTGLRLEHGEEMKTYCNCPVGLAFGAAWMGTGHEEETVAAIEAMRAYLLPSVSTGTAPGPVLGPVVGWTEEGGAVRTFLSTGHVEDPSAPVVTPLCGVRSPEEGLACRKDRGHDGLHSSWPETPAATPAPYCCMTCGGLLVRNGDGPAYCPNLKCAPVAPLAQERERPRSKFLAPEWFGPALAAAMTADFRAHVGQCPECQQGPDHMCAIGQYWKPMLKFPASPAVPGPAPRGEEGEGKP